MPHRNHHLHHHHLSDPTLHLPRILCLHGGGTNAVIFHAQCRLLRETLKDKFRLCFADAPFPSEPGPDVTQVYRHRGPFRRWLRFKREHGPLDADVIVGAVDAALAAAIRDDDERGATGEWVGLLGFSQGAKMCASLLFRQQVLSEMSCCGGGGNSSTNITPNRIWFRFAVLLAGRGPLNSLLPGGDAVASDYGLVDASHLGFQVRVNRRCRREEQHLLRLPTVHVHGMQDGGLPLHQALLEDYCDRRYARVVQWDGGHRVPVKTAVVTAIVNEMVSVARESGILVE